MKSKPVHVILNPASAGGKTGRNQNRILRAIEERFGPFSLAVTRKPLDAMYSSARAAADGAGVVLVVGGDGTIQEAVNGLFRNGSARNHACELAVLSSGTGGGFAQSLGIPRDIRDQVEIAAGKRISCIDVGKLRCAGFDGAPVTRYFVNECQIGIGGEVVRRVRHKHKSFGGLLAFGAATVFTVFQHQNQAMTISADNFERSGLFCGVAVANGAFTGGGMNLAPGACMNDHVLDLLVISDLTVRERLRYFPMIYSGAHVRSPRFSYSKVSSVTLQSNAPVLVAADGELLGTTPCTIATIPSALNVRC